MAALADDIESSQYVIESIARLTSRNTVPLFNTNSQKLIPLHLAVMSLNAELTEYFMTDNHYTYNKKLLNVVSKSGRTALEYLVISDNDFEKTINEDFKQGQLVLSSPDGYDTTIGGPGGVILSGGQKQLLGLARAFYGNTHLLVLDEPNANLDSNGEARLINAINVAREQNTTTVFITYKLPFLSVVDKVIIMSDGVIYDLGPKDEILSRLAATLPDVTEDKRSSASS